MKGWGNLAAVLGVTAISVTMQSQAIALTAPKIGQIARECTVRVEGKAPGSGVIIKKVGNVYTGLTVSHLVSTRGTMKVTTPDGESHSVPVSAVKLLPQLDLAVFQFVSPKAYPVVEFGNSDRITGSIYAAGYPLPTAARNETFYRMTSGTVIAKAKRTLENGYALLYSNPTVPGMNGGPLLDSDGRGGGGGGGGAGRNSWPYR